MTDTRTSSAFVSIGAGAPRSRAGHARWFALLVACSGMLMIVLDATIVTVALPTIQRSLRFSGANLAWSRTDTTQEVFRIGRQRGRSWGQGIANHSHAAA